MNKNIFFLLAVSLLVSANGMAQLVREDHLEPVNGYFEQYSHQDEYYANVKSILFNGLSESPECRFFVLTPYPEQVLQIERKPMKVEYELVF